MFHKGGVFLTT